MRVSKQPWLLELEQEQASPAVAGSFATSARHLASRLSPTDLDAVEQIYRNPHETMPVADPLGDALVRGGLLDDDDAARKLIGYATGVHRDPLRAIAAQALLHGDDQDRRPAFATLGDLATNAQYAEAAATLSVWSDELTNPEDRNRWREYAASVWAPSVSRLGQESGRLIYFASYYVAHVLAAHHDP